MTSSHSTPEVGLRLVRNTRHARVKNPTDAESGVWRGEILHREI